MTFDERLDRQSVTARTGWRLTRARPELLASTLRWLDEHPSGMPDVDAEMAAHASRRKCVRALASG